MFDRYYRELLNFLAHATQDRETAADLAQESYARVLAAQREGQVIRDPRALLYRTARNLMIDRHRRGSLRDHDNLDTLEESVLPAIDSHLQPDEAYAANQRAQALVACIEALPPRCREAFVLFAFEGLSQAMIAERMGTSISMVEKHIVRARLACRAVERRWSDAASDEGSES